MLYFDEAVMLRAQIKQFLQDEAYAECLPAAQHLVALHKENQNTQNIDYANDAYVLGFLLERLRKYDLACDAYREAAAGTALYKGRTPQAADRLTNLGACCSRSGKHDEAIQCLTEAYRIRKELLGEAHPETADSLYNLGNACLDAGQTDIAIKHHRAALVLRTGQPETIADSLICLSYAYEAAKNYENAEAHARRALRLRKQSAGELSEAYILEFLYYAGLCDSAGLLEKAAKAYGTAALLIKKHSSETHLHYAATLNKQADIFDKLDDAKRSIFLRTKALRLMRKTMGEYHMVCASNLRRLAFLHKQENNAPRAAQMMADSLRIRERLAGAGQFEYVRDIMWLCGLYIEQADYARAFHVLKDALDAAEARGDNAAFTQMEELFKIYIILNELNRLKEEGQPDANGQLLACLQALCGEPKEDTK